MQKTLNFHTLSEKILLQWYSGMKREGFPMFPVCTKDGFLTGQWIAVFHHLLSDVERFGNSATTIFASFEK